jgi:LysR family transcriptional regulator, benzoate and cis,cis-muconate-responsive activator of ben and cat genes
VFPRVEIRHLLAVITLAEELNFRRAANRLHLTQPALSKQITELEAEHRFHLFTRNKRRIVELTDAGRVFVEEARSALSHTERAVHLARAAHEGSDSILTIGHSPYADHDWVSAMLAIRLPLYPRLAIRLKTQFAMESVHSVLVGEVNLALVTAPPEDAQLTAVPFAPAPLYAVLPENHPAAHKERLVLQDLAKDEWILFAKRVHPLLYEAVMDAARRKSIIPKHAHDVMAPQQAVDLVSDHVGIAILTQPMAPGIHIDDVVVKPLSDATLCFQTCVIMRADNVSRLVNEYVRMFLRKYVPQRLPPKQVELSPAARVLDWKTPTPPSRP